MFLVIIRRLKLDSRNKRGTPWRLPRVVGLSLKASLQNGSSPEDKRCAVIRLVWKEQWLSLELSSSLVWKLPTVSQTLRETAKTRLLIYIYWYFILCAGLVYFWFHRFCPPFSILSNNFRIIEFGCSTFKHL